MDEARHAEKWVLVLHAFHHFGANLWRVSALESEK